MDISPNLPFSQAFDFASEAVAERFQNPFWKLKEFFVGSQLRAAMEEVRQFGRSIVSVASLQRAKRGGVMATCKEKFTEDINGTASKPMTDSISSPIKESENLINSLLDHIDDQQIVADAAMNYLSAGLLNSHFLLLSAFYFTISPPPNRNSNFSLTTLPFPVKHRKRHNGPILNLDFLPPNAPPFRNHQDPRRAFTPLHPEPKHL